MELLGFRTLRLFAAILVLMVPAALAHRVLSNRGQYEPMRIVGARGMEAPDYRGMYSEHFRLKAIKAELEDVKAKIKAAELALAAAAPPPAQ